MKNSRLVIIGLDGVPFGLLKALADSGVMPNTAAIIQHGVFKQMRSSIPEISSVAWSSIITGENPGKHGIFGFMDLEPNSYQMRFPNFTELKAPPFWQKTQRKSVIINVPSTYPVTDMPGVHISGFVSIDIKKSVYPPQLVGDLQKMDYRLDVDSQKAHEDLQAFLKDLDETLTARIEAYRYLWDYIDWDVFMLAFTGTDRLMHFLWEAWEDKNHKYHNEFIRHYNQIDQAIGEIADRLGDSDRMLLLSDHGFEKLQQDVFVNQLLVQEGFLTFSNPAKPNLAEISSPTKAFALDPARIFVNERGKYPAGTVGPEDKEACIDQLIQLFSSFQLDGRAVIKKIFRKEEIYDGPYRDHAADLILMGEKGFNLRAAVRTGTLAGRGPFTGKHSYEDAFLLLAEPKMAENLPEQPSVIDAGKLIRALAAGD